SRTEIVGAESLPLLLDEAILHPVIRVFAGPEAVAKTNVPDLDGAVERDRFEEGRPVPNVHQVPPPVERSDDTLVPGRPAAADRAEGDLGLVSERGQQQV